MANLGRFRITAKADGEPSWTNLTELAGITEKCYIQNINNACVCCEKETMPNEDEGFIVAEGEKWGTDASLPVWVKPYNAKNYLDVNVG